LQAGTNPNHIPNPININFNLTIPNPNTNPNHKLSPTLAAPGFSLWAGPGRILG